jgi:hypothetical protein
MKKSELLRALQTEIQRHSLSTFMNPEHKIVETGCPACQKHFGTVEHSRGTSPKTCSRRYWIGFRPGFRRINSLD